MNIIDIVKHGLGTNKQRQEILKAAKISDSTISRFLHGRAGLDPFALTRLFIAMGYTLTDKGGNKLITKINKDEQIMDNLPPAMQQELESALINNQPSKPEVFTKEETSNIQNLTSNTQHDHTQAQ